MLETPDEALQAAASVDLRPADDPNPFQIADRTAGLHNLGNTCFMNSALQCLANTPEIRAFATASAPARTADPVMVEFQLLIRNLWDRGSSVIRPAALKECVSSITSSFTDWEQHDAMEFLEFLLNHLAEASELGAKSGALTKEQGSAEQGGEPAGFHRLRSLFTGFLETTITCPFDSCAAKRARVEPVTSVKLPSIDPKLCNQIALLVLVMPKITSELSVSEHRVFVEQAAAVRTLLDAVAAKAQLQRSSCLCASLDDGRLKIWSENDTLNLTSSGQLLVYELGTDHEAQCFKSHQSGPKEITDMERRVCPDDGMTYTFRELQAAFAAEYSAADLQSYWHDAMALAPTAIPDGTQSAVIVHSRVDSPRKVSKKCSLSLPFHVACTRDFPSRR